MAFADYSPRSEETVESGTQSIVPPAQTQFTHHPMPQTWEFSYDQLQCQIGEQADPGWRPYQGQQYEGQYWYQHYTPQQYYQQHSLYHGSANLESQHLIDDPKHQKAHLRRSTDLPNGGALRSSQISPTSPHDSHSVQDDSTSVGSGSRQPDYTWASQSPNAPGQTFGRRLPPNTACIECRLERRRCDKETPCWPCRERKRDCDRPGAAPAITKEAFENHAPTLQDIRNTLPELLDRTSSGVEEEKRQKNRHDPGDSAMWSEAGGSRILSPPQREDAHRTGPQHLTHSWPSLKVLLRAAHVKLDRAYVMKAEERPPLCLYPEDEEVANRDDAQAGGFTGFVHYGDNIPGNALPTSTEYCSSDLSGDKSKGYGVPPQRYAVEQRNSIDKAPLDAATVEVLYESYIEHIHAMQPFLDIGEVRPLLDDFIAWHSIPDQSCVAADRYEITSDRPPKRRRHDNHSGIAISRQPRRRRPLSHAVVYLILALGKICMHSGPLPADLPSTTRKVPGLYYYAKAIEIFGPYSDRKDLIHAQLFLLAGLYKGQLARVNESMSWYTKAGWVLRQLLSSQGLQDEGHWRWNGEAPEVRRQSFITDKPRNSILLASFLCIELESDILAELDLPSSGIVSLETMLPMPGTLSGSSHDDPAQSANIHFHFTSQVYLRIQLNQIHRQLYGPDGEGLSLTGTRCILQKHEAIIGTWQKALPAGMSWDLQDPPPTNILYARLCAKYWGVRYLINRPFLDFILHMEPHPKLTVDKAASDSHGKLRHEADYHLFRAISEMSEEEVQIGYQTCIKAAEKSTIAFDNVLGRPIVTNIHGTAHAQFGNVLVLCNVYWHPGLSQLVDETNLRRLLSRTISFLDSLAPISPTCREDCLILQEVQKLIFNIPC